MVRLPIRLFKVQDRSMEPDFEEGAYIFVNSIAGEFVPGDVVVLKHPSKGIKLIKRIAKIREQRYYVIGDNHIMSEDSRSFGSVPRESILGKVIFKV
jgi:nickel-type superoxide dismutase maturation protease